MRQLYLITGPRGSGKTTWCAEFVSYARANDLNPRGLLSPPLFEAGKKVGIDLLDIGTSQQRPLARPRLADTSGILLGDWCFDPACFDWGNQILSRRSNQDFIVLDEFGPLEFERGLGLVEGLKIIDEERYQQAFVVIRPELLDIARTRWPDSKVMDISTVKFDPQLLERDTV